MSVLAFCNSLLMLATFIDEFFMKVKAFSALMGMMMCFLEGPFVVILIHSLGLLCLLTMLCTWSTFLALREGNASLIFKTSDVFAAGLVAWAYDFPRLPLDVLFSSKWFLDWKYLGMVLMSFFGLVDKEERGGGALLTVTGVDFGIFLLPLPLTIGVLGVNFDEIFDLSVLVLRSVWTESHLAS